MPSFIRIIGSIQSINFFSRTVDLLHEDLFHNSIEEDKEYVENLEGSYLNVNQLTFKYPDSEKPILSNINLILNKSEYIGIIGDSGSGKSTFISILLGVLEPNSGEFIFKVKT